MAKGFLFLPLSGFGVSTPLPVGAGTAASYLLNDYMGMVLRATPGNALDIHMDLGAAQSIDCLALLNSNAPVGVAYRIEANETADFTDASYRSDWGVTTDEALTVAGGFRHILHEVTPARTYRYWRLYVGGQVGHTHQAARVLIGAKYSPERNFSFGVSRGIDDAGEVEHAPRGASLRRRARKMRTLGLSWQFVSEAEAEGFALPLLERAGNTEYLLACLNPDAHVQRTRRMYFGNLKGDLSLTWRAFNLFEKRLQMQSVI